MSYATDEAKRLIPDVQPQRQDSTTDQLDTVLALGIRAGCYDAVDLIRRLLEAADGTRKVLRSGT